ncbi:hypothetical protein [Pseudomonas serbica]|uniref:hypothetical protein n=1 Tax=Pseudomonas serbica TaxID=2965074 RepID=UPI00237ADDFD|nr:hypothetical protein [Pseudomonas serbica]
MDRIFLTDSTNSFMATLASQVEPLGKSVFLTLDSPFSEQMENLLNDHDGSPIIAVLNIGNGKPIDWHKPLAGALASRVIGGVVLPERSSIFVLTEWSVSDLATPDFGAPYRPLTSKARLTDVTHDYLVSTSSEWESESAAEKSMGYVLKNVVEGIERQRLQKSLQTHTYHPDVLQA